MKALNISTLELHRVLAEVNVQIPQRTLHAYLLENLDTCKDGRIRVVLKHLMQNRREVVAQILHKLKTL